MPATGSSAASPSSFSCEPVSAGGTEAQDQTDGTPPVGLPYFEVSVPVPDIGPWIAGNTGVTGFTTLDSGQPGPHVALVALMHGNEIAGAIVLDRLLRGGFRPLRGRLTLGFANLAAFARFDPRHPTVSRFVDEDLNRLWDDAILDGPRRSTELDRAREIRPLIGRIDLLLDLHSMLWPSDPLMLCGASPKGAALARSIGLPDLIVADHGHRAGPRLIDHPRFLDPASPAAANLIEAGQHWTGGTVELTHAAVGRLLRAQRMADTHAALPAPGKVGAARFAEVTQTITATTSSFAFVRSFRGGDVIARRNTLIALDGTAEIRTPHDDCLLVMPSLRPSRGHTAVRLARFVEPGREGTAG